MDLTVHRISSDIVRPSSPTPDHLKTLKLSLLDQLAPPCYITLILFYRQNPFGAAAGGDDQAHVCQRLRQSLSQALAVFYPMAGKLDPDNFAIQCDDSGAEFVEARVEGRLDDVLQDPNMDELNKLLPVDPSRGVYAGEGTVFMAQVNFFDCGGIAVSACMAHNVADYNSLVDFTNSWATICRGGGTPEIRPGVGAVARHFPARDISDTSISCSLVMQLDGLVTKRFVFDKEKISSLKTAARSDVLKDPTRVESVSAFIWKQFLQRMSIAAASPATILGEAHVVNIRSRADPSMQIREAFGNACILVAAFAEGVPTLSELAARLRRAIRKVDAEYVTEMDNRFLADLQELCTIIEEGRGEGLLFSSWCGFPVYDVDFGWGRPDWVCTTSLQLKNLAILMSDKTGEDIQVFITLLPEDVDSFDREFRRIGSAN